MDEKTKEKAKRSLTALLALTPPEPGITDPLEWAKKTTLVIEQLNELIKLQKAVLDDLAPIVVTDDSPMTALLLMQRVVLLALKVSGHSLLKANDTEPESLLEMQKAKARDLLSDADSKLPEEMRNALLELLGQTEEKDEDEAYFPEDGITLPDLGGLH